MYLRNQRLLLLECKGVLRRVAEKTNMGDVRQNFESEGQ